MKIRTDFITNSSSSSFVAFVVSKDEVLSDNFYEEAFSRALESAKEFYTTNPEYGEEGIEEIERMKEMDEYERQDYVMRETDTSELLKSKNLEIGGIEDEYVGVTVETILNKFPDIKVSEIRKTVAEELNKEFGTKFTEEDVEYVEEVWRDG